MIYVVRAGDTLAGISLKLLGTSAPAPTLFQINRSAIKSGSPSKLAAGERLIIPDQMIAASKRKRTPSGPNEVALEVFGIVYTGWQSMRVSRSMETASASFDLDVFDRWAEKSEPWPIFDGDEVRVWIGSDLLVEGYVDRVSIAIDATSRGMRVSGRDRTADLVDCSAMNRPGTFKNKKLEELAQILAQPFGVKVAADVDTGDRIASFTLLPGEKVHEAISRAAIAKNLLVTSGLSGTLSLTRSGSIKSHDSVVEGVNLLAGDTDISSTERFSDYVVEGQASGQGRNNLRATFRDAGVNRYRPLMLCAEQKPTQAFLKSRVEWEARSRAAKSRTARITLAGWRQSSGELWQINRLIPVKSASLGLDEELLIGEVTFELSDSGMLTSLALVRPDAFTSAAELQAGKDLARLRRKGARKRKASASSFVPEFNYDER